MQHRKLNIGYVLLSFLLIATLLQPAGAIYASLEELPQSQFGTIRDVRKEELAPGASYNWFAMDSGRGKQKIHFVEFDPAQTNLELQAGTKDGYVYGMKTVTEMAAFADKAGNRVIAGINADFFDISGNATGVPNGIFMNEGRILNSASASYAFGIKEDGTTVYGKLALSKSVTINGVTTELTHINRFRALNQLVLYTTDYNPTTKTSNEGDELLLQIKEGDVRSGSTMLFEVLAVAHNQGNAPIGEGQAVLSASGTAQSVLAGVQVGDELSASFALDPLWQDVKVAVGGQGPLIKDGVVQTGVGPAGVHPRTAIGTKADGSIVMFEIDGRSPGFSEGVETEELAQILADIGVVDAMNLDGGGSSTLIAKLPGSSKAEMLNRGSDGAERKTGNGLLLVNKAPELSTAAHIAVQPSAERVLAGSSISFSGYGIDANGHPAPLADAITWEADEQLGAMGADGRLHAANEAARGLVKASSGDVSGTAEIEVVDSIDELIMPDASRSFTSGASLQLSVTAMRAGQVIQADTGSFEWSIEGDIGTITEEGLFTATDSNGVAGKIVVSYGGVSTSMDVSVGLPPVMLEDFENGLEKYMKTSGAAYKYVSASNETDQDYVRSGSHSLKLEYDFTGTTGTSGAYLTATAGNYLQVPGYPEKISMWVYGDGKQHWLRGQFRDGDNKKFAVDYTDAAIGVDWVGWKYIEVDIPKGKKLPLSMDMPVRYMETSNNKKDAGAIYVDDIRVLYGPSNDDILPPVIKNIVPDAGTMVKDAHPDISFIAEDEGYDAATSPGTTLIDPESIRVYLDGELVEHGLYPPQGRVTYKPVAPLAEGRHRVKAAVRDMSGNQTIKEWNFTVNLGSPYYSYTTPEKQFAGGTYTLDIHAEQVSTLSGGHIEFVFDDTEAVEELQVIRSEKLKEDQLNAVIDEENGKVRLSFAGLQGTQLKDSDLLGQISYKIKHDFIGPLRLEDLEKDVKKPHSISVLSGSIEKTDAPGSSLAFYGEPVTAEVWPALKLSWDHYSIGLGYPAQFTITNVADGSKVEGASLIIDDVSVAVNSSNQEGVLVTDLATQQVNTYLIQAVKDQMYSPVMDFTVASPVFTEQPVNISVTMGEKPAESRRFNWHTHIDVKDTVVEYAKESEFISFSADNVMRAPGSNELFNTHSFGTYRVHRAEVTGLEPGTAYKFRVGNGEDFVSAEGRFVTSEVSGDNTKFVFIGDSQGATEKDYALWKETLDSAIADTPDAEFIVHAGDMVDKGFLQQEWNWWFAAAQQHLMQRTLIAAIGNHEVMGTNGAGDYLAHFNNPDSGPSSVRGTSFSFDVNDTHFVLLNTELGAESFKEQAQWLDQDLKDTDKKWKVIMFHQGPYGSVYANERVQAQWVPIFDKYGVDLVLNGHDHVYLRTYPMKSGAIAEKGGTRYVIGGSSGSKLYALVNKPWQEVTFDQGNVETDNGEKVNLNLYTSVEITKDEIKVIAKTVPHTKIPSFVVDTLIIEKQDPEEISVAPSKVQLKVGDTLQLKASIKPLEASQFVRWSIEEESLAGVVELDESGKITALRTGEAKIRVYSSNKALYADVSIIVSNGTGGGINDSGNEGSGNSGNTEGGLELSKEQLKLANEQGIIMIESSDAFSSLAIPVDTAELLQAGQVIQVHASDIQVEIPAELLLQIMKEQSSELKAGQIVFKAAPASTEETAKRVSQAAKLSGAGLQAVSNASEYRLELKLSSGESKELEQFQSPISIRFSVPVVDSEGLTGLYKLSADGKLTYVKTKKNGKQWTASIDEASQYIMLKYDKQFADVASKYWAAQTIKQLSAMQLLNGISKDNFAPERKVTRAEFTAMIVRIVQQYGAFEEADMNKPALSFGDVKKNDWFAADVAWAVQAGLVNGKREGVFAPEQEISRQEMAAIIARAFQFGGSKQAGTAPAGSFADVADAPAWAKEAIEAAARYGLMKGHSADRFDPAGQGTRAQSAQMMINLLKAFE